MDNDDRRCIAQAMPSSIEISGGEYRIASLKVKVGKTKAPGMLTESDLITLMEKHKIGTDASIPTHIQNILTRNYAILGHGRTLSPSKLGVTLVHGYVDYILRIMD